MTTVAAHLTISCSQAGVAGLAQKQRDFNQFRSSKQGGIWRYRLDMARHWLAWVGSELGSQA